MTLLSTSLLTHLSCLSFCSWNDWQVDSDFQPHPPSCHHQGAYWNHLWCCCFVSIGMQAPVMLKLFVDLEMSWQLMEQKEGCCIYNLFCYALKYAWPVYCLERQITPKALVLTAIGWYWYFFTWLWMQRCVVCYLLHFTVCLMWTTQTTLEIP